MEKKLDNQAKPLTSDKQKQLQLYSAAATFKAKFRLTRRYYNLCKGVDEHEIDHLSEADRQTDTHLLSAPLVATGAELI